MLETTPTQATALWAYNLRYLERASLRSKVVEHEQAPTTFQEALYFV
jgi:hypothetical protein